MTCARIKFSTILAKKCKFNRRSSDSVHAIGLAYEDAADSTSSFNFKGRGLCEGKVASIFHYEFNSCLRSYLKGYSS